jgi:hypothetical protein
MMKLEKIYSSRVAKEYTKAVLPEWLTELSANLDIDIAQCEANEECNNGDIEIVYHTRESLEDLYADSILALDIESEAEEKMYLELENMDAFKGSLMTRLDKTKLWNYPPDVRDSIKKARSFLKRFMEQDVSYGFTVLVPADEAETFMADEEKLFGIRECKYHIVDKPAYVSMNNINQGKTERRVGSAL